MKTILFQGDSITDAGRDFSNPASLGYGYPAMTAGKIGVDFPGCFRFLNRGVSGNRIVDLYARIRRDIINQKPDYLSILIGVNDVWHEFGWQDGVPTEKFRMIYDMLLTELKEALPELKILILEPFVLPGSGVEQYYDAFCRDVQQKAEVCRELARKHGLVFVPLQEKIKALAENCDPALVLEDGVHPTAIGHELISRELYRAYRELL